MISSGGSSKSESKPARVLLLVVRLLATGIYVGACVWFTRFYLYAAGLLKLTDASARSQWIMLVGDCKGQTVHQCASDLTDYSLAVTVGIAGVAAAVIPAIWFTRRRWELVSVFVAAVGGLVGLVAAHDLTSKTAQLVLVLCAFAFSLVVNFAGRALDSIKARAARKPDDDKDATAERWEAMDESLSKLEKRANALTVWRAFRLLKPWQAIPLGVLVFALPVLGAVGLFVALVVHL